MTPGIPPRTIHDRAAFTMVEVVISLAIVSMLFISAMAAVGKSRQFQILAGRRAQANDLADALLNEILSVDYQEPVSTPAFGREAGESDTVRTAWDDVDDYHGWSASPPQSKTGAALTAYNGWTRACAVDFVNPDNPTVTVSPSQGVKRIVVTVSYGGVAVVTRSAIRTNAWQEAIE